MDFASLRDNKNKSGELRNKPMRIPMVRLIAILSFIAMTGPKALAIDPLPRPIDQITPGTLVSLASPVTNQGLSGGQKSSAGQPGNTTMALDVSKRWNQLILFSATDLRHGDVDAVTATIRDSATKTNLVVMATIAKGQSNRKPRFELAELGVGYSTDVSGQQKIVTGETVDQLGGSLGFIAKQVLKKNQAAMVQVKVVAESRTLQLFDAPTIFLVNGSHQRCLTRHLIWIDPNTGAGAMLIWLIRPTDKNANPNLSNSGFKCLNTPMRLVRFGVVEKRGIHVDGNEFTFGIPSEMAFALVDLPPGTKIAWTEPAKAVAGKSVYRDTDIDELSKALNQAINQSIGR